MAGISVKKFCAAETVSEASFYQWRKKLAIFLHTEPTDMCKGFDGLSTYRQQDYFAGSG